MSKRVRAQIRSPVRASAEVVAALVGGAFALVVFIGWELRADAPLIPMRFFATRAFSAGNAAGFLLFACIFSGVA